MARVRLWNFEGTGSIDMARPEPVEEPRVTEETTMSMRFTNINDHGEEAGVYQGNDAISRTQPVFAGDFGSCVAWCRNNGLWFDEQSTTWKSGRNPAAAVFYVHHVDR